MVRFFKNSAEVGNMNKNMKSDIAIIGAGVIGCAIVRRLSRYNNSVIAIEKEADIGWGTTKANSGIMHAGYAGEPESLKLRLSPRGNKLFRKNAGELDIPIKKPGSLVNANDRSHKSARRYHSHRISSF